MKNLFILAVSLLFIGSCQAQDTERYTQQGPEIDMIHAHVAAYNAADWETFLSEYSPNAEIEHNTSGKLTREELIASFKETDQLFDNAKIDLLEQYTERAITDQGDHWVNTWGEWTGTAKSSGEQVKLNLHITFRIEDDKIVEEHAYYDMRPFEAALEMGQERIVFIEAWNVTDAWKALSDEEQGAYFQSLAEPIQQMTELGVEVINWGANDASTDRRGDYDFFAIWSFPNEEARKTFEQGVAGSGWYKYFEQVNLSGTGTDPQTVMGELIKL